MVAKWSTVGSTGSFGLHACRKRPRRLERGLPIGDSKDSCRQWLDCSLREGSKANFWWVMASSIIPCALQWSVSGAFGGHLFWVVGPGLIAEAVTTL